MKQQTVAILYYASGIAAGDKGCQDGPKIFQNSNFFKNSLNKKIQFLPIKTFEPQSYDDVLNEVARIGYKLAISVKNCIKVNQKFIVIGGDHSSAIGTWSGAKHALSSYQRLGLIWVDAHLDSHTVETSLSHNIHGMPLAALMGYGATELTHLLSSTPKLRPQDVFVIGARSYEQPEYELLQKLNVRVYEMEEIRKKSFSVVLDEILEYFEINVDFFGLSVDLDSMDPKSIPGVGTPEPNGIEPMEFLEAIQGIAHHSKFLGAEIAEYNPHHDVNQKTQDFIESLIHACFM